MSRPLVVVIGVILGLVSSPIRGVAQTSSLNLMRLADRCYEVGRVVAAQTPERAETITMYNVPTKLFWSDPTEAKTCPEIIAAFNRDQDRLDADRDRTWRRSLNAFKAPPIPK